MNLRPVALRQRAVIFHRLDRRLALQRAVQFRLELLVGQRNLRFLHAYHVVSGNIELRHHFECCLEPQRLAIRQLQVQQLRLRHRLQFPLRNRAAKTLRNQGLQHLLAQLFRELRPHQRLRHLARAEAGNARQLLVALRHRPIGLRHLIRRDFNLDLAHQFRIQRRPGFVLVAIAVLMAVVVLVRMLVAVLKLLGLCGVHLRFRSLVRLIRQDVVCFLCFRRVQIDAFQQRPNGLPQRCPLASSATDASLPLYESCL